MNGTLREMRWAIMAAQHRSLRQAAEALHIQQSTLSCSLHDLEHQVGVTLFEKTNGGHVHLGEDKDATAPLASPSLSAHNGAGQCRSNFGT
jgi:DNA-binding transcriptional LysR family regulator